MSDRESRTVEQQDVNLLFHRIRQLESEDLPKRVAAIEGNMNHLQDELTAIKEITKTIGQKLDAGVQEINARVQTQYLELKYQQLTFMSFVRGVMWVGGVFAAFITFAPIGRDIVRHFLTTTGS